jgi:DNA-binding response OmpR family regulator
MTYMGYLMSAPRIVVFNHSPNLLLLYRFILQRKGYNPYTYQEQMTDLNIVKDVNPDLIILGNIRDYNTSELNTLFTLKANDELKAIPVIICTIAAEDVQRDQRVRNLERVAVVPKPFLINLLVRQIEVLLRETYSYKT